MLHGLGFKDDQIDGDVGALSGGWKMRVSMAKILLTGATFCDQSRLLSWKDSVADSLGAVLLRLRASGDTGSSGNAERAFSRRCLCSHRRAPLWAIWNSSIAASASARARMRRTGQSARAA